MENGCFSCIGCFKFQVIVGSGADILHILHVVIDSFDHMMTGGTDCYQILAFFPGLLQCTDRRKLCGNFIASQRINTAAALPVFDFFQFKSKRLGRSPGIGIQVFCFVFQGTSRIITVLHNPAILSLFLSIFYRFFSKSIYIYSNLFILFSGCWYIQKLIGINTLFCILKSNQDYFGHNRGAASGSQYIRNFTD